VVAREAGLRGRTVVVTRDEGADGPLTSELEGRGAQVLHWPTVRISPPENTTRLDAALESLGGYDWIVFTSARAVTAVFERLPAPRVLPSSLRIAAVGPGTSLALRDAGWCPEVEPEDHSSIALVRALASRGVAGGHVLFPASSLAGRALVEGLSEEGASVDDVVAYRTVRLPLCGEARDWAAALLGTGDGASGESASADVSHDAVARHDAVAAHDTIARPDSHARMGTGESGGESGSVPDAPRVDAICFASPSAVDSWREALGPTRFAELGRRVLVGAIGSTTAAALRNAGCVDLIVAAESTFPGLVDAVEEAMERTQDG